MKKNFFTEYFQGSKFNLNRIFLEFIRLYTFYSPIRKGKYRLFELALKMCSKLPPKLIVETVDGRKLNVHLADKMYDTVYFLGEYELSVTKIIKEIVRESDVCIDAGANFGWYATLLSSLGVREVHAFEPVLPTFHKLEKNFELAGKPKNFVVNNLALGDEIKKIKLHVFDNQPDGHASISTMENNNFTEYEAEMTTLDNYLSKNLADERQVNFIKVDVEGAEMLLLRGAQNLFNQTVPPMLVMEMALATSRHFGYKPNDLIKYIQERAEYDFFIIDEYNANLKSIEGFAEDDIGANVLCIPKNYYRERLENLKFV
jgi:FkbM family methyltransferase